MNKISVLMPTYNDSDTICETLDSLISQKYDNWELIIIDDGSTDNTKFVIEKYKKGNDKNNKIKYIYQDNADQLLAIINGLKYITGEYIYILHSDDLLYDDSTFERAIKYFNENPNIDEIMGNLAIIDEDSNITSVQKVLPYKRANKIPAIQLLWLGRNLYIDFAFHKKQAFLNEVYNNYLVWNKPYWLNTERKISMLNVKKVDCCFLKYRIYSGNYANNELGKLCLINGELRTATQLMKFYDIPFYKFQYFIFRIFYHLNIFKFYYPIFYNRETKNKYKVIDFIIKKRYHDGYTKNTFFDSLSSFYKNYGIKRSINFDELYNNERIYFGNGFRLFNKQLLKNELPKLYTNIFKEMKIGFDVIEVSKQNFEKAVNITKFLCIYPFVEVLIKKDE